MQIILRDIEITEFAPVVIPTLCRYKHLKNLLESLAKCRLADKTEVYIAVDFPKKETHRDGYTRICEYLDNVKDFGFKKLHIIKREKNFGFGENGNARNLINYVLKSHDRFIFTEDDNVFAPGFLEFMNYNLYKFKEDKKILSVSGYMFPVNLKQSDPKIYKLKHFSAWGCGTWKDRWLTMLKIQENRDELIKIFKNPQAIHFFLKNRPVHYTILLGIINGRPIYADSFCSIMQVHKDWFTIFPSKSLVRNCGWDGSGTHGGVVELYSNQSTDVSSHIDDYSHTTIDESNEIDNIIFTFQKKQTPQIQRFLTLSSIYIYKLTGKYCNFSSIRNFYKKIFR